MSKRRPASTSWRVMARSSALGVGSPLGWLWATMMAAGAERDREPEHFPGMHQGGIEDPPRNFLNGDHAGLGVERDHVEHFDELSGRPLAQQVDRVLRAAHLDRLRLRRVHFLDQADPGGP